MTTQINQDSRYFSTYIKPAPNASLSDLSKATSVSCGKRMREIDADVFAVPMVLKRAKKSEESNHSEDFPH